jgi:signal transduction histidine kinase
MKHAKASLIQVTLTADDSLSVCVEDDGIGYDPDAIKNSAQSGRGLGLFNIENRARVLGATVFFDKERAIGSKITLVVPYEKV